MLERINGYGEGEAWRIKHYHLYYDYPVGIFDIANRLELYNLSFYHDKRWLKALMGKSLTYTDSLGFGHDYLEFHAPNWENCKNEVKVHTSESIPISIVNENKIIIETIAKNNKNINVYLVIPPCWHSYRDIINKKQMDVVIEFCNDLEENNSNIKFVDLFADKRFIADDFADSYHLAEAGAKKLTLILNNIIRHEN